MHRSSSRLRVLSQASLHPSAHPSIETPDVPGCRVLLTGPIHPDPSTRLSQINLLTPRIPVIVSAFHPGWPCRRSRPAGLLEWALTKAQNIA